MSYHTKTVMKWIFVVCLGLSNASREDILHGVSSELCPYSNLCKLDGKAFPSNMNFKYSQPCCQNCSCTQSCAETVSCCPDKDGLQERKDMVIDCKTPYVKAPTSERGIRGYRVIDYCPVTEENKTLISKCTGEVKLDFEDYIWVEDTSNGMVYQNKFCAKCHNVVLFFEWNIITTCTEGLSASFDNIKELLFSSKCHWILQPVQEHEKCFVLDYTECNQTGLWSIYDAVVDWACNIYYAPYAEGSDLTRSKFTMYKNPFCYACNKNNTNNANPICRSFRETVGPEQFSALIDYKLFQGLELSATCNDNEIMDNITGFCRTLLCPLGSAAKNRTCMPLFKSYANVVFDIKFALTVISSSVMYSKDDDFLKLLSLGNSITNMLQRESELCLFCRTFLEMTKDVLSFDTKVDERKEYLDAIPDEGSDIHFKLIVKILTSNQCQVMNVLEMVAKIIESSFHLQINETTSMQLKVRLIKSTTQNSSLPHVIRDDYLFQCSFNKLVFYYQYDLQDERSCPHIRIKYSEFAAFNEDSKIIDDFFTKHEKENDTSVSICVDDYYLTFANLPQGRMSASYAAATVVIACPVLVIISVFVST